MDRKMGLFSRLAASNASGPQTYQSTCRLEQRGLGGRQVGAEGGGWTGEGVGVHNKQPRQRIHQSHSDLLLPIIIMWKHATHWTGILCRGIIYNALFLPAWFTATVWTCCHQSASFCFIISACFIGIFCLLYSQTFLVPCQRTPHAPDCTCVA